MSEREGDSIPRKGGEEEEPWLDLIQRIDSSNFTRLFRNMVLISGLLHLRESSDAALKDLQVIIQETESFSKRIALAKEKHPEVDILNSIERNLGEFSFQTDGFQEALTSNELRGELELLSQCLLLSRSLTPERKMRNTELARRLTKLARHIKLRDEGLREMRLSSPIPQLPKEERDKKNREKNQFP